MNSARRRVWILLGVFCPVSAFHLPSRVSPLQLNMMSKRFATSKQFDVLLYGATGFTGKLVAAHLSKAPELNGPERKWAIAGRSEGKLVEVRDQLKTNPPQIVVCDLANKTAVEEMVSSTRVVLNCAGPFSMYNGSALMGACAHLGRHYSDLSGESFWQREMIVENHDVAAGSGAKLVLGGGVDSIPSDIGAFLALEKLQARADERVQITGVYNEFTGWFSGGTIASGGAVKAAVKSGRLPTKLLRDPYILAPGVEGADSAVGTHNGFPRGFQRQLDSSFGLLIDFVMAGINANVVRRSLALRHLASSCAYRECASVGYLFRNLATWLAHGFGFFVGEPINLKPRPGQGPPQWLIQRGGFTIHVTAATADKTRSATTRVSGRGDPGYGATAKMLGEVGLSLAFDADETRPLPGVPAGGVLTPSTALGSVLVQRLTRKGVLEVR